MATGDPTARVLRLSPRQALAVRLCWEGCCYREMSRVMGCSPLTVQKHMKAAYAALGIDGNSVGSYGNPRVIAAVALFRAIQIARRGRR